MDLAQVWADVWCLFPTYEERNFSIESYMQNYTAQVHTSTHPDIVWPFMAHELVRCLRVHIWRKRCHITVDGAYIPIKTHHHPDWNSRLSLGWNSSQSPSHTRSRSLSRLKSCARTARLNAHARVELGRVLSNNNKRLNALTVMITCWLMCKHARRFCVLYCL